MHNAPSVIYPVGRCRFLTAMVSLLALAGLGLWLLWWTTVGPASATHWWAGVMGAVLWLAWVTWASVDWWRLRPGRLQWDAHAAAASLDPADGQGAWRWHEEGAASATRLDQVEIALDLQFLALLRLQGPQARCRWAWVERRRDLARWNDLRRAIHSAGP